jgi:predicted N-acetyltransferase YhbS
LELYFTAFGTQYVVFIFGRVLIYGNPKYYGKFRFKNTKEYGITDMEGNYNDA